MNKRNILPVVLLLALSAIARDSNDVSAVSQSLVNDPMGQPTNQINPRLEKKSNPDHKKHSEKKREKYRQRRIQLMERELNKIGVSEEQKALIIELQKKYKEKMQVNAHRISMAREKLSKLQDDGAPMEVLETAILDVSAAQAEQLRTLVRNRMEMERILGREKLALFMQNARTQYQKQGHRSSPPLPPRPGLPPTPGQSDQSGEPPVPPQIHPAPEKAPSESL